MPVVATACRILLISGSLRGRSTNTALLRTAQVVTPDGVATVLYDALATLPHFNPDDDREGAAVDPAAADLRAQITDVLIGLCRHIAGAVESGDAR